MTTAAHECALCSAELGGRERTACNACLDELYQISTHEGSTPRTNRPDLRRHLMRLRVTRELRELEDSAA